MGNDVVTQPAVDLDSEAGLHGRQLDLHFDHVGQVKALVEDMGQGAPLHLLLPGLVHLVGPDEHSPAYYLFFPDDQAHLTIILEQEVEAGL